MKRRDVGQLGRRCAIVAAVIAAGFLAGWSAVGITDGVVMGIALGAGVAAPMFRSESANCLSRHKRHQHSQRTITGPRD